MAVYEVMVQLTLKAQGQPGSTGAVVVQTLYIESDVEPTLAPVEVDSRVRKVGD